MPMTPHERDALIEQHVLAIEKSKQWMAATEERVKELRAQKRLGVPVDHLLAWTLEYSNSEIAGRNLIEKRLARLRAGLDLDGKDPD